MLNIDKVYIINLSKSTEDIKNRINSIGLDGNVHCEIFPAIDGRHAEKLDIGFNWGVYDHWKLPKEVVVNEWWNRDIVPGEIGCSLSHISIWHKIVKEKSNINLILEEDFIGIKPIKNLNVDNINEPWDLLYLGRIPWYLDQEEKITAQINRPKFSYTTHAYILTLEGAKKLLSYEFFTNNIIPIDEFLPATFTTHPRSEIEKIYSIKKIKAMATNETWVNQTSVDDITSTTLNNNTKNMDSTIASTWLFDSNSHADDATSTTVDNNSTHTNIWDSATTSDWLFDSNSQKD